MRNKKSIGLPGGPNEYITHVSEMFSTEGYKRNSPDVNNPYNVIPSANITMDGVDIPVRGYGNNGMIQDMIPGGGDYNYGNADYVVEVPMAQTGREQATISQYEEPAWYEKALDYAASPMTALSYIVQGKDLPDRLPINVENRNAYDMVIDMINPAAMIKYGAQATRDYDNEEYLNSAFNTLGALPIVPAVLSQGKNVVKGGKNIIKNTAKSADAVTEAKPFLPSDITARRLSGDQLYNIHRYTAKQLDQLLKESRAFLKNTSNSGYENSTEFTDRVLRSIQKLEPGVQKDLKLQEIAKRAGRTNGDDTGKWLSDSYINAPANEQLGHVTTSNNLWDIVFKSNGDMIPYKNSETLYFNPGGQGQLARSRMMSPENQGGAINLIFDNKSLKNSNILGDVSGGEYTISQNVNLKHLYPKAKIKAKDLLLNEAEFRGIQLSDDFIKSIDDILDIKKNGGDMVFEVTKAQDGGDPEMIFKEKYNTPLTKEEKIEYDAWVTSESKRQGRDITMDLGAYDIQGFWKSGDYMKMDEDNHGSDKWKKPNHPTFSNQSNYHNIDGYTGGTWAEDGGYTPSEYTRELYDKNYYDRLFGREPNRPEYLKLPKKQDGNGEYKVESGDTFYGIANKNNIPWEALKEANPDLDYDNLKLDQKLVLPNKIDRSPPTPKAGQSKNSNVLDYNALSNYLVDTRGGTTDTWGQLADTIAYHESSPWSRMDPKAKQYQGGPGRGLFQFEGESFDTALKRYKNVADAKGFTIKDSIINAKSADELSSEDQYALFLANLIESKTKLSDFVDGNISSLDVWLTGHKNVEADGDRASFLESKKAAEKEGIKNGYKTFQYGNGEERYVIAQDNTRVVRPRLDVLPDLNFESSTPLQDFLNTTDPTKLNDDYGNDRVVVRDNTFVNIPKFDEIDLPTKQISSDDYEKILLDIAEEERLTSTPYDSPNLIADFIRKSNEYSRGWKDMSEASESEIIDLQEVLLNKGYNIGRTGVDGIYGRKTYAAHQAMVDDLNLNPTSISRYHKKYSLDTKQEVMGIQQKLVDEGYLSPTLLNRNASSIDGKFGDQTKEALDAYNTANTEEDPQALVFDFIPSTLEETRCAAGMCTILEGNEVMTDALGVKYKDAWDIFENMDRTKNSNSIYNIYDDNAFKNVKSVEDLKRITKQIKKKKQTKAADYKIGDIVGLYWDGSSHHEETLNSKTHNTHSGFVSDIINGVPIITHNVNGSVRQQPYNELVTAWIRRPNENLDIKSKYNVDGIEDIEINNSAIQNLAFRYSGPEGLSVQYEGDRLKQLENIFKRTKYNSLKIPKILNSSVDSDWLESTIIGITGVETGVGKSVLRSRDDVPFVKGLAYEIKGKQDKDISLGIGKTKLASLDNFAKEYFDITSVDDLKDDGKGLDAIAYMLTKNYELFKDYAKEYPSLGLTETDIRNMSILAYNQGSNRLLKTGRVDDDRTPQEEIKALRDLYDATLMDISSTNYKHIPGVGQQVFEIAQAVGLEKPSDSYIKKVNSYRSDLFPETFASVEEEPSPFEMSSMAQGGEYGVYNNYISGKYDGTYREKSATELYNKLNAKHYQEAKQRGMSVPNFIMTELIKDS